MTRDHYTDKAKAAGMRARSAYKLLQINQKYHIIKPGNSVLDLGCWPGGWLIVAKRAGALRVVGIDLEPTEKVPGAELIQGDVAEEETMAKIAGEKFDVVLSDMAPHTSGNAGLDVSVSVALAEIAFERAKEHLKQGGIFLAKIFQGAGFMEYVNMVRKCFSSVRTVKPEASKQGSREMYVLGMGFR